MKDEQKAAHTPGPWTVLNQADGDWLIEAHEPYTYGVATVHAPSEAGERSEGMANARLIAAATELLDALRYLVDRIPNSVQCRDSLESLRQRADFNSPWTREYGDCERAVAMARLVDESNALAAIAKSEGR